MFRRFISWILSFDPVVPAAVILTSWNTISVEQRERYWRELGLLEGGNNVSQV